MTMLPGSQAQVDLGAVLKQVAPQDSLGAVCKDERFKVVLKSICEPDGEANAAIRAASDATLAREALTLERAMELRGDVFYGEGSKPEVREVGEGERCGVIVQNTQVVPTADLRLRSSEGNLQGAPNDFVLSGMEMLTEDVAQFITSLRDVAEEGMGEKIGRTETLPAAVTVFSASKVVCGAGLQCMISEGDVEGVSGADDEVPGTEQINGTCTKCKFGSYCPVGVMNDESGVFRFNPAQANQCPQGYFCPDPSTIKDCPAGLFCPSGSARPLGCNDLKFDMKRWGNTFSAGLDGNFCPPNSREPWQLCPGGHYCPNASIALECPDGYYCPVMSSEPRKCPLLSYCPSNSDSPSISWIALVGTVGVALVMYGTSFFIIWRNKTSEEKDHGEEEIAAFNEKITKTICEIVLPTFNAREISDVFKMGNLSLVSDPLRLNIKDLTVTFKGRTILDKVSLSVPRGSLNAIFGPSGAGKTTLIKSMLGKLSYNLDISGKVSFTKCTSNEEIMVYNSSRGCFGKTLDFFETSKARKKVIQTKVGYVPQDNVVYPNLTVRENILFSVKLRNKFVKDRKALTDQILNLLGLFSIRNSIVGTPEKGGISGGECRRVSIGLELAGCPLCLVLDEPTTGLDAVSADRVLKCLNFLTGSGMTIIASIHQPKSSIFHLFSQTHVLMKGGFVVYTGPKNHVTRYFAHLGFVMPELENPADFIIDIVSGLVNCKINASFTTSELPGMWRDNKEILEAFARSPSFARMRSDSQSSPDSERDPKMQTDAAQVDEDTTLLLDAALPDLQKELNRNQELNSGKAIYNLTVGELKDQVIQICSACFHLEHFGSVDECARHIADRIRSCLSPEFEVSPALQGAASPNREDGPYSRLSSLLSFKSTRHLMASLSFKSVRSFHKDQAPKAEEKGQVVRHLKRQFKLTYVLLNKDVLGWVRSLGLKTVDLVITAIFAIILGFNQGQGFMEVKDILYMSMLINLYVGMLSVVVAINLTLERLKSSEREAGGGISTALVFTSSKLADLTDHVLRPTVFSILFYFISLPRMSFGTFYAVVLGVSLSCSGLGDFIAVIFPENLATVAGLIIAFAFGGIMNGYSPPLSDLPSEWIVFPSYARWGVEALCLAEFREYNDWKTETGMMHIGYSFDDWKWCLTFLYVSAVVLRICTYPLFRKKALS